MVDDNTDLAEDLREILAGEGFLCRVADDAETALAILDAECFDAVVTDLRLPRADGVSVIQATRRRCPATRVVLMTAFVRDDQVRAAHDAGIDALLLKPFAPAALLNVMTRL